MNTLKNCIAVTRIKQGLSQDSLARSVGISRNSIGSIERGEYIPLLTHALRIARVLGVNVEDIFCLEVEE